MTRAEAKRVFPEGYYLHKRQYDGDAFCAVAYGVWLRADYCFVHNLDLSKWLSFQDAYQAMAEHNHHLGDYVVVLSAKEARHKCLLSKNRLE